MGGWFRGIISASHLQLAIAEGREFDSRFVQFLVVFWLVIWTNDQRSPALAVLKEPGNRLIRWQGRLQGVPDAKLTPPRVLLLGSKRIVATENHFLVIACLKFGSNAAGRGDIVWPQKHSIDR